MMMMKSYGFWATRYLLGHLYSTMQFVEIFFVFVIFMNFKKVIQDLGVYKYTFKGEVGKKANQDAVSTKLPSLWIIVPKAFHGLVSIYFFLFLLVVFFKTSTI